MKTEGFTTIELLAVELLTTSVIVAVLVTVIVLGINC
jgi:hypothetical protein